MGRNPLNQFEYEFLTNSWSGARGASYNSAAEYCYEQGYYRGFYPHGTPNLTHKGVEAVKAFQENESRKRIDVI